MKRKRQYNIKPEALHFCSPAGRGPILERDFVRRLITGARSLRSNNYETQRDYSFRSVQSRFSESIRD